MNKLINRIYDTSPVFLQNWFLTGFSILLDRERYGGKFKEFVELLSKTQWYSREDLKIFQEEQLRKIIRHAYETVPYYRKVFDERKLKPSDIKVCSDLQKVPLLTRDIIKTNFEDLISRAYSRRNLKAGHTSGTTGSPLELYYDASAIYMTYAALDRQYKWAGCRLARNGDRIAVARGNVIVPLNQTRPPYWRFNRYHNQLLLSSFHMSPSNLDAYFEEMIKFRPTVIDGYPSTLYVLAKYLKNKGMKFPVKAVISSSETLYDFQRETIEESFQCRNFDYYALAERVAFATECDKHEGHHLSMEYGISEVLDMDNRPLQRGNTGKLVATGLFNFGMPLIRYVSNDMTGIKEKKCSCGRGLELMDDVTTKAEDTLTLKDGRLISPSVLTHPFKPLNSIEASQIIQKDLDRILIKIIPRSDFSNNDINNLVAELKARIGEDMAIEVKIVDSLPRTSNGKFRWVISEVPLGI